MTEVSTETVEQTEVATVATSDPDPQELHGSSVWEGLLLTTPTDAGYSYPALRVPDGLDLAHSVQSHDSWIVIQAEDGRLNNMPSASRAVGVIQRDTQGGYSTDGAQRYSSFRMGSAAYSGISHRTVETEPSFVGGIYLAPWDRITAEVRTDSGVIPVDKYMSWQVLMYRGNDRYQVLMRPTEDKPEGEPWLVPADYITVTTGRLLNGYPKIPLVPTGDYRESWLRPLIMEAEWWRARNTACIGCPAVVEAALTDRGALGVTELVDGHTYVRLSRIGGQFHTAATLATAHVEGDVVYMTAPLLIKGPRSSDISTERISRLIGTEFLLVDTERLAFPPSHDQEWVSEQIDAMERRINLFKANSAGLNEELNEQARERDWCSEYEQSVQPLMDEWESRESQEEHEYNVVLRVTFEADLNMASQLDREMEDVLDTSELDLRAMNIEGRGNITLQRTVAGEVENDSVFEFDDSEIESEIISKWSHVDSVNVSEFEIESWERAD